MWCVKELRSGCRRKWVLQLKKGNIDRLKIRDKLSVKSIVEETSRDLECSIQWNQKMESRKT